MMKQTIIIVSILWVVLLFGQTATQPSGTGTSGDPYLITSLENLYWIADQVNNNSNTFVGKYLEQTQNIDATSTSGWFSNAGWEPIGNGTSYFGGSFDGKGKTISGLNINRPESNYIGLFGYGNGQLSNVVLTSVDITGNRQVGGLAGFFGYYVFVTGSITNCSVSGTVNGNNSDCGLLVGWWVSGTITGCSTSGTVTSSSSNVGGLVGDNDAGTITECYSTATVSGYQNVGGLTGYCDNGGDVTKSYATGNVSGTYYQIGGLIGATSNGGTSISTSYAHGDVTGQDYVGGLIGQLYDPLENCYALGTVTATTGSAGYYGGAGGLVGHLNYNGSVSTSYAAGHVTSTYKQGGLVGYQEGGTLSNNMYDNEGSDCTNGVGSNASATGVTGKTTNEMKGITSGNTISDWSWNTSVWERVGSNYPRLQDNQDASLPVSLTDFSGVAVSDGVKLSWTTESEMENLGFNLYRKALGGDYTLLASYVDVPALAGFGNTSAMHKYAYTDQTVAAGMTYSYLLGDVSYDGVEKKHSDKVISVTVPENGLAVAEDFMIGSVYPNPFNAEFTIPFSLSKPMAVEIALYDVNGNRVKSINSGTITSGLHHVRTNASDLSTGLYFVKILAGDRQFAQKLMLIK